MQHNVSILSNIDVLSYTTIESRIEFYRTRFLRLSKLIEKSAKARKLTVATILDKDKDEMFLSVVRINEIKVGAKFDAILCEQLCDGVSYTYSVLAETESEHTKYLFVGLIVGTVKKQYNGAYYLIDLVWPHEETVIPPIIEGDLKYILALSDIHVSSVHFNKTAFENCIKFINSTPEIKYVVIAGDLKEGINVFKDQQNSVTDYTFEEQNKQLINYIRQIRTDVTIVLSPGNHDNEMGIGEPQSPIHDILSKNLPNVVSVTNPALLQIEHLNYLVYHGRCQNSFMRDITSFNIYTGVQVQKLMMRAGHLSPMLDVMNVCRINKEDYLLVEKLPHVFHVGHTHVAGNEHHKGITYVNGGSFQHITPFQKQMGITPHVGSGVLINMLDYRVTEIIRFDE